MGKTITGAKRPVFVCYHAILYFFVCAIKQSFFVKSSLNALLKATKMSENGEVSYLIFISNVSNLISQTVSTEIRESRELKN